MLNELFGKTQTEQKRNLIRIIYLTVAVILTVCVALTITLILTNRDDQEPADKVQIPTVTEEYSFSDTKTGTLLIVNKSSAAFDFSLNPESELVSINNSIPSKNGSPLYSCKIDGMLAKKEALTALNEMIEDFYSEASDKEAARKLSVWTAYRSYEDQSKLSSVPAGHSDFHTGLLFELTVNSTSTSIKTDSTFDWIYENAHKYGFVERYPESKSSFTGVSDFDNAFRFVGKAHATYIKDKGISLEEYVEILRSSTEPIKAVGYKISYVKANESGKTEITHTSRSYSVSGDNMGGFIVTSK